MKESRRAPRHRQRVPVTMDHTTHFTVNLGVGGFCTETVRVLQPGTDVAGALRVHGREYAYRGRVAWAIAGSPRLGVRGRMGVCFSEIEPEFLDALGSLTKPVRAPVVVRPAATQAKKA